MIIVALCVTGISFIRLIFGSAVPQLKGHVVKEKNLENPSGIAVCLTLYWISL